MIDWIKDALGLALLCACCALFIAYAAVLSPPFTDAHPVIHDFKMNAGGNNVSADSN